MGKKSMAAKCLTVIEMAECREISRSVVIHTALSCQLFIYYENEFVKFRKILIDNTFIFVVIYIMNARIKCKWEKKASYWMLKN